MTMKAHLSSGGPAGDALGVEVTSRLQQLGEVRREAASGPHVTLGR